MLDTLKPELTSSQPPSGKPTVHRFIPILGLVAVCWGVFTVNNLLFHGAFLQYGIIPRRISGLLGIIWSPFLHASLKHLTANTLPLLVLGAIICGRSRREFAVVTFLGALLTGALTWLLGREAIHIGASGLVFCFFGYLSSLAYFKRNFPTLLLSVICLIGYGGMLRGVLPTSGPVSWESHIAGALSGIVMAWFISKANGNPLAKFRS
jgi:membrane associated rhomboid family serine protease